MNDNTNEYQRQEHIALNCTIGIDQDVEIRKVHKRKKVFSMTHRFNVADNSPLGVDDNALDILDLIDQLSTGARKLFIEIKLGMSWRTNIAILPATELTKGQVNKRSQYSKELLTIGLARKVKCSELVNSEGRIVQLDKGAYMVNPTYMIPPEPFNAEVVFQWNFLTQK